MILRIITIFIALAYSYAGFSQYNDYEVDGNMPMFYEKIKEKLIYPQGWGNSSQKNFSKWRKESREILLKCLEKVPAKVAFSPQLVSSEIRDGYRADKIVFNVSEYSRISAYLLVPEGDGEFPAIVLLHDHGAKFSIGKEKMIRPFGVSDSLMIEAQKWVDVCYDGEWVGDYFARNGYVVLCIDALLWGDRGRKGGDLYETQQALSSNLFQMGMSWCGLITYDDIRSAEFLASLDCVDEKSIAAVGFSMGAHRAWMLAAATDVVSASVAICWMNTTRELMTLKNNQNKGGSAYSMLLPNIRNYLDYPHVASIACPKPMLFFNGRNDKLFPVEGVESAYSVMRDVWNSRGVGENLVTKLWNTPHVYNKDMQHESLEFLNKKLKK